MPWWETSFDNTELNAAQTLLELQSNIVNKENVVGHNITVTAGVVAARTAPKKRFLNKYTSSTRETCDVETQTEDDYSNENKLQLAVTERDQTIEQLRKDLAYYKRLTDTVVERHDTPDDEVNMTIDDSDTRTPDRNLNTDGMVKIGNKIIPSKILKSIKWSSYTSATRQLLSTVFSRRILATHSLTGKPSPAFPEKVPKKKLDQAIVNDLVHLVAQRCNVAKNLIRLIITTKCADEAKRETKTKKRKSSRILRENIRPESDSDESDA